MNLADRPDDVVIETLASGYETVIDAFTAGLQSKGSHGAALSVWHGGEEVVNVWAGLADDRTSRRWSADTLSVLFSASKGLSAIVLARLAETGRLDLDAPIAELWPEFAAHGKGAVSIADVLAHRAGVSAPADDLSPDDVIDSVHWAELIAAQEPLWQPGAGHAYHALTFGPMVEEIVRRATGRQLHEVFKEEVAQPLGADVTLKPTRTDIDRVAHLTTSPAWAAAISAAPPEDDAWIGRALTLGGAFPRPLVQGEWGFNDLRIQRAGLSAAGGLGTASGLARIWSATVAPTAATRLLSDTALRNMCLPRSEGAWHFDPGPPYHRWGSGVQLSSAVTPWFTPETFGHDGAGGQSGIADPRLGVALGYVRNNMDITDAVAPIITVLKPLVGAR